MRIYLIGMPGCGKSTIGKVLANQLNTTYIDLDAFIERNALMFIDDLFESYGEVTFRRLETEALASITEENAVIACGGGIVKNDENQTHMQGLVIFLDASIETLEARIASSMTIRPLLKTMSLETLFKERYKKYLKFADVILDANAAQDVLITQIIQAIKERAV